MVSTRKIKEDVDASVLNSLYQQIDALFDELKKKLADVSQPRRKSISGVSDFLSRLRRNEGFDSLSNYLEFRRYDSKLRNTILENISSPSLDSVIDRLKDQLKYVVRNTLTTKQPASQNVGWSPSSAQQPQYVGGPSASSFSFGVHGSNGSNVQQTQQAQPQEQPVTTAAVNKGSTSPPIKASTPAPQPQAPVMQKPAPVAAPTPATAQAAPVQKAAAPAAAPVQPAPSISPIQDKKLAKMGMAIVYLQSFGSEITPETIEQQVIDLKGVEPGEDEHDKFVKIAQDYIDKNKVTKTYNRQELMGMKPKDFKDIVLTHDKELADTYEGQAWWSKPYRDEIVTAYLSNLKPKTESLRQIYERHRIKCA